MFVVWKRPDGFHDAEPKDFRTVQVGTQSRIWLHKKDNKWFPFRISGEWQEQEATQRLNQLINLLGKPVSHWSKFLVNEFHHSMTDDPIKFFDETSNWLSGLKNVLKGDTWEVEIMTQAIIDTEHRLNDCKASFMQKAKHT